MNRSTTTTGALLRPLTLLAAVAVLALATAALVRPVFAGETYKVWLQESQQGSSSTNFTEDEDCGDYTTGVVWHFILNQYSGSAATLYADFQSAGTLSTVSQKVLSSTQHFYLNTPTDDTLLNAYAEVDSDPGTANLVLSHVCHTGNEATPTPAPTPTEQPTEQPTQTPEGSVEAGTGTPAPSLPDGAMGATGGPSPLPTVFFGLILLASLATLAWVNVKAVRNRG